MKTLNFRLNLDKTFKDKTASNSAKKLIKDGKKISKSLFNPKETTIYLSVTFNSKYYKINTGLKVKPENFDIKSQSIKTRDSQSIQLQLILNQIINSSVSQYRELLLNNIKITPDLINEILKKSVNSSSSESPELSFFEIYDQFFEWKSKTVNVNTLPRYRVLRKELLKFEMTLKKNLSIHSIDKKFSEEFSLFLISDLRITNNTISKYLKSLKCFLNYCVENNLTENTKFKQIKSSENSTSIFVLEEFEIRNILNLKIENEALFEVQQIFCFLCYTGQRYSDVKNLKKKDIHFKDQHYFWRLYQYKTKSTNHLDIPLLPEAINLIKSRLEKIQDDDYIFKVLSNQKMNAHLKVLGSLSNIKGKFTTKRIQGNKIVEIVSNRYEKITTHTGRKSFITLALKKEVPITAVQKISGHSSIKAMKPYIDLSNNYVASVLFEKFNN